MQRAAENKHQVPKDELKALTSGVTGLGEELSKLGGKVGTVDSVMMDYFAPSEVKTFYKSIGHKQTAVQHIATLGSVNDLEDKALYFFVITTEDYAIRYCKVDFGSGGIGHTSLSHESLAIFAGVMMRVGSVIVWSSGSGHYKPKAGDAGQASIPKSGGAALLVADYFIGSAEDDDDAWEACAKREGDSLKRKCARVREENPD